MKFSDQTNLYLRLKRLLSPKSMGDLFKVILAYKFKINNHLGFKFCFFQKNLIVLMILITVFFQEKVASRKDYIKV